MDSTTPTAVPTVAPSQFVQHDTGRLELVQSDDDSESKIIDRPAADNVSIHQRGLHH